MKPIRSPLRGRVLIIGLLALVPALAMAAPASAAETKGEFVFQCMGATPKGEIPGTIRGTQKTEAPESVEFGDEFKITIHVDPFTVPRAIQGRQVVEITEGKLLLNYPTDATFLSASFKDGTVPGSVDVTETDDGLLFIIHGPVHGGDTVQLPDITLKVQADVADTVIETDLAGESFEEPGLALATKIRGMSGTVFSVNVSCFPESGAVLSTTEVGGDDNGDDPEHHKPDRPKPDQPKPDQPKPDQDQPDQDHHGHGHGHRHHHGHRPHKPPAARP